MLTGYNFPSPSNDQLDQVPSLFPPTVHPFRSVALAVLIEIAALAAMLPSNQALPVAIPMIASKSAPA